MLPATRAVIVLFDDKTDHDGPDVGRSFKLGDVSSLINSNADGRRLLSVTTLVGRSAVGSFAIVLC